jgi:hypothetical protein
MWFATIWKYCERQWFQNMIKEVLRVANVLLSHHIGHMESIDSPNHGQHEILGPDLLLHLLRDIISQYAPFRRMMELQNIPSLVPNHTSLNLIFLVSFENGQ